MPQKTYVIGDIHGCLTSFDRLLEKIAPVPNKDALIILGDMVDRGPDSSKVLERLIELRAQHQNVIALKGNHEAMFLDFLEGKKQNFFLINGGDNAVRSYGIENPYSKDVLANIPEEHVIFLQKLLPYWEDEHHIFVHAGIQPGVDLERQSPEWLYWARSNFIEDISDFGKTVIFGHTPFREPLVQPNKIGIDTGAVYGGKLTCLVLPDMKFVSVPGERHWIRGAELT